MYLCVMTKLGLFAVLLLAGSVFLSCEKEEEKKTGNCSDGFMNNGETGADCGGPCAPCEQPLANQLVATFHGREVSFLHPYVVMNGDEAIISGVNDSIEFSIHFEMTSDTIWPLIDGTHTKLEYNGDFYNTYLSEESHVIVTNLEETENHFSGLFRVKYVQGADTILMQNGSFLQLRYN